MKIPEIRIYYAWLYRQSVSEPLYKQFGFKEAIESDEVLETYADNYRKEWAKYESQIVPALCDALGLEFYQRVIDAPCMPGVVPASDPLIMSFQSYPDRFVDELTHELCHVLLTDNTTYSIKSSEPETNLSARWQKLFEYSDDFNTIIHIPVHALCKYMYLDVHKDPSRLERDERTVAHLPDYKAAWDYVNDHDYRQIIADIKTDYQKLASA